MIPRCRPGLEAQEEKRAIADKEAARPYGKGAYNSARQKQIQAENKERNKRKRGK